MLENIIYKYTLYGINQNSPYQWLLEAVNIWQTRKALHRATVYVCVDESK